MVTKLNVVINFSSYKSPCYTPETNVTLYVNSTPNF